MIRLCFCMHFFARKRSWNSHWYVCLPSYLTGMQVVIALVGVFDLYCSISFCLFLFDGLSLWFKILLNWFVLLAPNEQIIQLLQTIKFPHFVSKSASLQSFKNWPKLKPTSKQLSKAGLFLHKRIIVLCVLVAAAP